MPATLKLSEGISGRIRMQGSTEKGRIRIKNGFFSFESKNTLKIPWRGSYAYIIVSIKVNDIQTSRLIEINLLLSPDRGLKRVLHCLHLLEVEGHVLKKRNNKRPVHSSV